MLVYLPPIRGTRGSKTDDNAALNGVMEHIELLARISTVLD